MEITPTELHSIIRLSECLTAYGTSNTQDAKVLFDIMQRNEDSIGTHMLTQIVHVTASEARLMRLSETRKEFFKTVQEWAIRALHKRAPNG